MNKHLPIVLLLSLLVSLQACVVTSKKTLETERFDDDTSLRIYSVVAQTSITSAKNGDTLSGLFAKLDKRQKKEMALSPSDVASIDEKLALVDVNTQLVYELHGALRKGQPFQVKNIYSAREALASVRGYLRTMPEDALLSLNTRYFFTPDLSAIRIETDTQIYLKSSVSGKRRVKSTYKNKIVVQSDVLDGPASEMLNQWLADNGYRLETAIREGLRETASLLAIDVNSREIVKRDSKKTTWVTVNAKRAGKKEIKGRLLRETEDRYVIRAGNGELLSLPRDS